MTLYEIMSPLRWHQQQERTMSRTFSYSRVSTNDQTTENQELAIQKAGYSIIEGRSIEETISGGVHAMQRPAFKSMVEHKLESGDTLVVLKLDRLGRDNIDVQQTIEMLTEKGIKVISLDLPVRDLTTSDGRLMLQIISSFAEFERGRLKERTMDGLARAKANGVKLGRPEATDITVKVLKLKADSYTQAQVAKELGKSVRTIKRHWNNTISA